MLPWDTIYPTLILHVATPYSTPAHFIIGQQYRPQQYPSRDGTVLGPDVGSAGRVSSASVW